MWPCTSLAAAAQCTLLAAATHSGQQVELVHEVKEHRHPAGSKHSRHSRHGRQSSRCHRSAGITSAHTRKRGAMRKRPLRQGQHWHRATASSRNAGCARACRHARAGSGPVSQAGSPEWQGQAGGDVLPEDERAHGLLVVVVHGGQILHLVGRWHGPLNPGQRRKGESCLVLRRAGNAPESVGDAARLLLAVAFLPADHASTRFRLLRIACH